jgi:hypothetical protein
MHTALTFVASTGMISNGGKKPALVDRPEPVVHKAGEELASPKGSGIDYVC